MKILTSKELIKKTHLNNQLEDEAIRLIQANPYKTSSKSAIIKVHSLASLKLIAKSYLNISLKVVIIRICLVFNLGGKVFTIPMESLNKLAYYNKFN